MIPASYLFKNIYQSRFERDERQEAEPALSTPREHDGTRGAHHPSVPYLAILGLFGIAR
jgi:hypothetical protein